VTRVAKRTGLPVEECDAVVSAIEEVVKSRFLNKLGFLKRIFSKI